MPRVELLETDEAAQRAQNETPIFAPESERSGRTDEEYDMFGQGRIPTMEASPAAKAKAMLAMTSLILGNLGNWKQT